MTQPEDKSRDGGPQHARGRHGDSSAELVGARGRDARSVFSPNELVAGRFKIVRFIGQGGMGDVYEAEDLELRERVALKTVRPEIAADEPAIARFKREIQLARRVTHPNVCRIFDVEYHRTTAPEGAIAFLTMELLPGETLAERLRRVGRLSMAEALPLVSQMAAALAAAHKVGIVHRDFKSANVILVPSKEEGTHAVVTDFGLARGSVSGDSLTASISGTGGFVGTPAYMAPEQVEGGQISAAADIYALGVVMYEMVTGRQPFIGDTPLSTAVKRLKEAPASPRTHVPDLDPKWESAILRCLERDPADRFVSAMDVVKVLGGEEVALGKQALEEQKRKAYEVRRKQRRWLALVGLTMVVVLASAVAHHLHLIGGRSRTAPSPSLPALAMKARRSVAVLGFKNLSGRPSEAWLSTALSEMLTTELAAGEKLRTIPGEDVARMKIDLSLPDADSYSRDTLTRIRKNLGADLVVLGSYFDGGRESGGQVRLDLRLQDAAAGQTIASVSQTGTEAQLLDLVSRTGATLREKLGIGEVSFVEAKGVQASLPSNSETARLYAEGLTKLRQFDALAARDLFEKVVAAEPNYALAHSALAEAWADLGYDGKAREEAKKAVDLSADLSREDHLLIEGRYREMTKDWDKAVQVYQTLSTFFPDNLEYGLRLADVETSSSKSKEALATVEALRRLPAPAGEDPRIDLAEALAAQSLSDFKRGQATAAKAVEKGAAQRARLLVAAGHLLEGSAFWHLAEPKKATAALDEAKEIFSAAGDRVGVAKALTNMGSVLYDQGDFRGAKQMFENALVTQREIGNLSGVAAALNNIGNALDMLGDVSGAMKMKAESLRMRRELGDKRGVAQSLSNLANLVWRQGDLARAKTMYEESLTIRRRIGDKVGVAGSLNNLAGVLVYQGDLAGARRVYEESLAIKREIGDKTGAATSLNNMAEVLHNQGDLARAKKTYAESLDLCREIGNRSAAAYARYGLGEALLSEGDLASARKRHEEALTIRNELGEKGSAAESRLALAEVSIEEGRPAEAEAATIEAAGEFQSEKEVDDEALADAILARSLLAQGKSDAALKAINHASTLAAKSQNIDVRLSVAIDTARVRAASGKASDSAEAARSIKTALAEATKLGFVGYQLEARLALGEIETKSVNSAAGRARLEALEKEATAKGFGLIARKAAASMKQ